MWSKTVHIREAVKKRLKTTENGWRKKDTMIKSVIEEKPIGKIPLGRPHLRWEYCVKRDVRTVDPRAN